MQCALTKFILFLSLCFGFVNGFANTINLQTAIKIQDIDGHGVKLSNISIHFDSLLKKSSFLVQIESVRLPEYYGEIKNVVMRCREGIVSSQEVRCNDGYLSFQETLFQANDATFTFFRKQNGDLELNIHQLKLADGIANLELKKEQGLWTGKLDTKNVSLVKVSKSMPTYSGRVSSGKLDGVLILSGTDESIEKIQGDLSITELGFSNDESTIVGEKAYLNLGFESQRFRSLWQTQFNSTSYKGELYFDPVFIDANENARDLYGRVDWQIGSNKILVKEFHIEDPLSMHIVLSTEIDFDENAVIEPIQIKVNYAFFPNIYDIYIQPFLLDTNAADLKTNGSLSGEILIDAKRVVQADLNIKYISMIDNQNRFSLLNLNGNLGWGSLYANKNYFISFDNVDLYKLNIGESHFAFSNQYDSLVLTQPSRVPLLDGSINIEKFEIYGPGKAEQSATMDISLTPVSMSKLSTKLGWPEMNGNLAGYAPNLVYKKGDIKVGGALLVRGFGGTTTIHDLYAEDLFSLTPKLSADIELKNLDLKSLTETFSFGEITGKMNGKIDDIKFVSWSPVQFDAWFGTPENDHSRHRISQTAVDNLTQVGNGTSNVLSKSFLKFFDSFGYDKLGIGCTLKNNTCKMHGVGSSGNGFYIVKGSGIPRIDIIGFTDEVSWSVLTARLKRVIKTQDIIVN